MDFPDSSVFRSLSENFWSALPPRAVPGSTRSRQAEPAPTCCRRSAGPTPTCCRRSAGPTPTCCRRTAHEISRHRFKRLISSNPRASPRIIGRRCRHFSEPLRPRRGHLPFQGRPDCRKTPGELERVATLSNFQSRPAACTVGTGRFLRRKIPFSRAKIVSLQFLRPEIS